MSIEVVQRAVESISPRIINAFQAGATKPDLSALISATKQDVVYIDPPDDRAVSSLAEIGGLTEAPFVINAPNREFVRKSLTDLNLHVRGINGDPLRCLASNKIWPDVPDLIPVRKSEKVSTLRIDKAHVETIGIGGEPEEKRLVTGVVIDIDTPDVDNQKMSSEEIYSTLVDYMIWHRHAGLQHVCDIGGDVDIVECWQVRADFMHGGELVKAGAWMITWKVWCHKLWQAFKDGTVDGFSIGGFRFVERAAA